MSSDMYSCWRCGKFRHYLDIHRSGDGFVCNDCDSSDTFQGKCSKCRKKFTSTHELGDDFVCTSCMVGVPDDSHYTKCGIEPWEYIRANKMDFFEGNVIKYVTRWRNKNGLDDLRKARVYIDELIRQEECKNE